jgi:hypothetical protein
VVVLFETWTTNACHMARFWAVHVATYAHEQGDTCWQLSVSCRLCCMLPPSQDQQGLWGDPGPSQNARLGGHAQLAAPSPGSSRLDPSTGAAPRVQRPRPGAAQVRERPGLDAGGCEVIRRGMGGGCCAGKGAREGRGLLGPVCEQTAACRGQYSWESTRGWARRCWW